MSKYIIALFICIQFSSCGQAIIKGIPVTDDEYAHFFASAYITEIGRQHQLDWWQNTLMILGVSVAKEVYDMSSTGFSIRDIAFNLAGVAFTYIINPDSNKNQPAPQTPESKRNKPEKKLIVLRPSSAKETLVGLNKIDLGTEADREPDTQDLVTAMTE